MLWKWKIVTNFVTVNNAIALGMSIKASTIAYGHVRYRRDSLRSSIDSSVSHTLPCLHSKDVLLTHPLSFKELVSLNSWAATKQALLPPASCFSFSPTYPTFSEYTSQILANKIPETSSTFPSASNRHKSIQQTMCYLLITQLEFCDRPYEHGDGLLHWQYCDWAMGAQCPIAHSLPHPDRKVCTKCLHATSNDG